jgi:asparagine N-glycosylation enzyme membrane subunit Stt3
MNWRGAFFIGAFFGICAFLYWVLPYVFQPRLVDYTGFVLLALVAVAMTFGFSVLLRGSRDL